MGSKDKTTHYAHETKHLDCAVTLTVERQTLRVFSSLDV